MVVGIRAISSEHDFRAFAELVRQYVRWCEVRYADDPELVAGVFDAQAFEVEAASQRQRYSPPEGDAFLAEDEIGPAGSVAYRRRSPEICEMKRLFVLPRLQGQGLGRKLSETAVAACRAQGFSRMRLDTMDRMTSAIAMYESMGFRRCAPYNTYPPGIMDRIVFMELPL